MSNYALYADLPKDLAERITAATGKIYDTYKAHAHRDPFGSGDYPHITIVYGPPILQSAGEIKTKEEVASIFPGLTGMFPDAPEVSIDGIDIFDSGWATVIKFRMYHRLPIERKAEA